MKQKDLLVFLLMLLPLSLSSCTTVNAQKPDSGQMPSASSDKLVNEDFPASGWSYETEITHEGSRSEGSVSRLFYRYNELPPAFSRLVIGGHVFVYVPMVNLWDKSGYIIAGTEDFSRFGTVSGAINRSELKNGWYQSEPGTKKKGTPNDWLYAESEVISIWVSPDNLQDVIELFGLKISRPPVLPEQAVKTKE